MGRFYSAPPDPVAGFTAAGIERGAEEIIQNGRKGAILYSTLVVGGILGSPPAGSKGGAPVGVWGKAPRS